MAGVNEEQGSTMRWWETDGVWYNKHVCGCCVFFRFEVPPLAVLGGLKRGAVAAPPPPIIVRLRR